MASILQRLLVMRTELDAMIVEVSRIEAPPFTPKRAEAPSAAGVPGAPKKRGRPAKLSKKESEEVVAATKEASEALEAAAPAEKPKRIISEEHKAKMKAGREAAKARKDAEKAAVEAAAKAVAAKEDSDDESVDLAESEDEAPQQLLCCSCGSKIPGDHRMCFLNGLESGEFESDDDWMKACKKYTKAQKK
jgi:hypothetical protein